jgi:hypothetical protein
MKKSKIKLYMIVLFLLVPGVFVAKCQVLVESVAAIVGNEVIYLSDLENTLAELKRSGDKTPTDELKCRVFQQVDNP